jgi:hypothetical protein
MASNQELVDRAERYAERTRLDLGEGRDEAGAAFFTAVAGLLIGVLPWQGKMFQAGNREEWH